MVGVENLTIPPHDPSMTAFWHAFFFSVQTFTTVGYGHVAPVSFLANIVAGFVALTGLMCAALMSGLFFARFSRPTASVAFSKNALVAPYRDGEAVMFRIANRRERSELINLKILVTASYLMPLEDGTSKRQFIQLPLERDEVMMFPTNWTLVHPLNEDSPFFGNTHDDLRDMDWELMVSLSAFDDTFAQTIYTRTS